MRQVSFSFIELFIKCLHGAFVFLFLLFTKIGAKSGRVKFYVYEKINLIERAATLRCAA